VETRFAPVDKINTVWLGLSGSNRTVQSVSVDYHVALRYAI